MTRWGHDDRSGCVAGQVEHGQRFEGSADHGSSAAHDVRSVAGGVPHHHPNVAQTQRHQTRLQRHRHAAARTGHAPAAPRSSDLALALSLLCLLTACLLKCYFVYWMQLKVYLVSHKIAVILLSLLQVYLVSQKSTKMLLCLSKVYLVY